MFGCKFLGGSFWVARRGARGMLVRAITTVLMIKGPQPIFWFAAPVRSHQKKTFLSNLSVKRKTLTLIAAFNLWCCGCSF